MPNQAVGSLADTTTDSNAEMGNDFDTSQLLNSSFFSSESVDVIDHSRSFRNSLVLREMSDFNLNASLDQDPNKSFTQNITQNTSVSPPTTPDSMPKKNPFKLKKNEIRTVNMSTSPSLSALSDLLNEKSKNAERKMKSSLQNDSSILEEEDDEYEPENSSNQMPYNNNDNSNIVLSPNLIDLNDEDNSTQPSGHVFVPTANVGNYSNVSIEQPDFLTTPKVEQQPLNNITNFNELEHEPIQEVEEEQEHEDESANNISAIGNNQEVNSQHSDPIQPSTQGSVAREESGLDDDNVTLIGDAERHPQRSTTSNWTRVLANHGDNSLRNNNSNVNTINDSLLGAGNTVLPRAPQPSAPPKQIPRKAVPKAKPVIQSKSDIKAEKQKKRRSLFSFFQKKPSKDKDEPNSMVRSSSLQQDVKLSTKPQTEKKRSTSSTMDKKPPAPIEKKSHSSSNLFNTFRKNSSQTHINISDESKNVTPDVNLEVEVEDKSISEEGLAKPIQLEEPLQLPKQRAKQEHDTSKTSQRKATPLDFGTALNTDSSKETNDLSLEKLTATEQLVSELQPPRFLSPRASDDGSKRDSGEVYFPKLLDDDEIDYITQIERNRSIRSNSRRRSTDTLSIKAQNDGMTVYEASDVILATPDLTKSPTSSILKNMGTFEASDVEQAFALGSIEERLNELTMTYDEIPDNLIEFNDDKVLAVTNNKMANPAEGYKEEMEDNDDNDLMNDIMEFANIIDFGDGINLDLDINASNSNTDDYQSKTFNPKVMKANSLDQNNVLHNAPVNNTVQNTGLGLQFNDDNANEGYPATLDTPITVETEQFEDEPFDETEFNPIQEQVSTPNPTTSPHMEEYLNHNFSNIERPLSMSFNGLMGKAMKNSVSSFNVDQLNPDQRVKFSSKIILYETYDEFEYDRHPDVSTCSLLTPQLAQMIKAELNELKTEMEVHEDSRCYTQFF